MAPSDALANDQSAAPARFCRFAPVSDIVRCLPVVKWGTLVTALHREEEMVTLPNPSIKNEKLYQDLRQEGSSKEKAARISNAAAARGASSVGRKGGKAGSYTDWTVPQLKKRAKELGISGYSGLTKDKLIAKLRNR